MKDTQTNTTNQSNPLQIIIWNMDYQEIIRGGKRTTIKVFDYYICRNDAELIMIFKNIDTPIKEWCRKDYVVDIKGLINKTCIIWNNHIKLKINDMSQFKDYIDNLSLNLDMEGATHKKEAPSLWITNPKSTYYRGLLEDIYKKMEVSKNEAEVYDKRVYMTY